MNMQVPDREPWCQELARRESNGIAVTLVRQLDPEVLEVWVDDEHGDSFVLVLEPTESPLDVFYHPFAYAARRGVDTQASGLRLAA
jgi:hypothetical protein